MTRVAEAKSRPIFGFSKDYKLGYVKALRDVQQILEGSLKRLELCDNASDEAKNVLMLLATGLEWLGEGIET